MNKLFLSTIHTDKSKVEISQNFVAFSEYMNFNAFQHTKSMYVPTKNLITLFFWHEKYILWWYLMLCLKVHAWPFFCLYEMFKQNVPRSTQVVLLKEVPAYRCLYLMDTSLGISPQKRVICLHVLFCHEFPLTFLKEKCLF